MTEGNIARRYPRKGVEKMTLYCQSLEISLLRENFIKLFLYAK